MYTTNPGVAMEPTSGGVQSPHLVPQPGSIAIDAWVEAISVDAAGNPRLTEFNGLRRSAGIPLAGVGNGLSACAIGAVERGSLNPSPAPLIFHDGLEDPAV